MDPQLKRVQDQLSQLIRTQGGGLPYGADFFVSTFTGNQILTTIYYQGQCTVAANSIVPVVNSSSIVKVVRYVYDLNGNEIGAYALPK